MNTDNAHLVINLGQTPVQQLSSCQAIKDAMAQCMIHRWESGGANAGDNTFSQVSSIYLQAATHASLLQP